MQLAKWHPKWSTVLNLEIIIFKWLFLWWHIQYDDDDGGGGDDDVVAADLIMGMIRI